MTSANGSVGIAGLYLSFTCLCCCFAEHTFFCVPEHTCLPGCFCCVSSWPRVQRALAVFWVLHRGLTFVIRRARPSAKPEAATGRPAAPAPLSVQVLHRRLALQNLDLKELTLAFRQGRGKSSCQSIQLGLGSWIRAVNTTGGRRAEC